MSHDNSNTPDPMDAVKKQWEAMGLDPTQMLQHMNAAADMQKNMQQQMEAMAGNNPLLQNIMNMQAGGISPENVLNLFDSSPEVKEDSDLNETDTKAILCAANLSYYNNQYLNSLSTEMPEDDILFGLENSWGVNNREELISTIDRLEKTGHRLYFDLIWSKLGSLPKAEWPRALKALELEASNMEDIELDRLTSYGENLIEGYEYLVACDCMTTLENPNILAWDFARAINLCRFGFDVKFLTREEALERIRHYAGKMYKTYDSWKALSEGYLIGFTMWNGDQDDIEERVEQHNTLLTHEKSLWTKVEW